MFVLACGHGFAEVNTEQQLKAAFLVNFLKYIEWPGNGSSATICLFGRDQLGPYLANYEGRSWKASRYWLSAMSIILPDRAEALRWRGRRGGYSSMSTPIR